MQAVRQNRYVVLHKDFEKSYKIILKRSKKDLAFYDIWLIIIKIYWNQASR